MKFESFFLLFLFSLTSAVQDIRKRYISLAIFVVFGIIGLLMSYMDLRHIGDIMVALLPGALLLLLSFFTRGSIGIGDALWFIVAATFCGLRHILFILSLSWIMCMLWALMLVMLNYRDMRRLRGKKLPYLAFVPLPVILGAFI